MNTIKKKQPKIPSADTYQGKVCPMYMFVKLSNLLLELFPVQGGITRLRRQFLVWYGARSVPRVCLILLLEGQKEHRMYFQLLYVICVFVKCSFSYWDHKLNVDLHPWQIKCTSRPSVQINHITLCSVSVYRQCNFCDDCI